MDESLSYRKSAYSQAECVEIGRHADGSISVRNSKDPAGPVVMFTHVEWAAFIEGVKAGDFDIEV